MAEKLRRVKELSEVNKQVAEVMMSKQYAKGKK